MFGPIPSGNTYFRDYGCRRVYGTPVIVLRNVKKTPLGYIEGARYTSLNYHKADYQGLKLPYTTTATVLKTSLGPYLVPIIKQATRGIASSLFSTVSMNGVLSGAHDITALTAYAGDIFGTVNSDAHLYISPNLRGNANSLFNTLDGAAFAFTPRYMQAVAANSSPAATGIGTIARIQRLIPTEVLFNTAENSTGYLYTYNFTVGTMKAAASLAW